MEVMPSIPDKYFDLAIVDPPYGIGYDKMAHNAGGIKTTKGKAYKTEYEYKGWDNERPSKAYFDELLRVSKSQIIWGGNYFSDMLPPSRCFITWDKRYPGLQRTFADCEYAYCSSDLGVARMFRYVWDGMIQENMGDKEKRIHPTQKPVALYRWLLTNYAKPDYKILDTHVGSGSSLIACEEGHYQYLGFEIDKEYFDKAQQRLQEFNAQIRFF